MTPNEFNFSELIDKAALSLCCVQINANLSRLKDAINAVAASEQLRETLDKLKDIYVTPPPHLPKVRSTANDKVRVDLRSITRIRKAWQLDRWDDTRHASFTKAQQKRIRKER